MTRRQKGSMAKAKHGRRGDPDTKAETRSGWGRFRWIWFLLPVALAIFGLFAWYWRPFTPKAQVPDLPLAGLEASVVELMQNQAAAVRANPRSGKAWGTLGGMLKSYGLNEVALTCLREAQRLEPREPRWPYYQGIIESSRSDSKALEHFRRTVRLCGNDPEMPRLRLARLLVETGQELQAREELDQLFRANPRSGPARLMLAQLSQSRGESPRALDLASGCVTNPFVARTAWTLIATIQRRNGDTNAAQLAARRAASATPDATWPDPFEEELFAWRTDARSLSDRAQQHLLAGRGDAAMPLVQRLVREHPNFPETWLLLGRALYLQRQPAQAEQALRRHLQMEPESVNGWFQSGMCLLAQGRWDDAATAFEKAITLKADFGPAYFNLGFVRVRSGRLREAVVPFQEAIRHNPEKIDSYLLLADLHLQLGERDPALRLAELAEKLEPNDRRLPVLREKLGR